MPFIINPVVSLSLAATAAMPVMAITYFTADMKAAVVAGVVAFVTAKIWTIYASMTACKNKHGCA